MRAALWLTLTLAGSAWASPLTVEEAVAGALSRPELAAALLADVEAAGARAVTAGRWANPELAFEHEQVESASEQALVVSQRFALGGQRGMRARAGEQQRDATRALGEAERVRLGVEVRRRFSVALLHQGRHGVLEGWRARLERALATITKREAAGDSSAYERQRLERELRVAGADVEAAAVAREVAWLRVVALLPEPPAASEWPRLRGGALPTGDVEGDGARRAEVRALELEAAAAQMRAEAAERGWVPDLTVSAGWRGVGDGERRNGFVAGLALELPLFDHDQGLAAEAQAEQTRARARHGLALADAAGEVAALRARTARLTALAKRFRAESLEAADALARTAEVAYAGGEARILELLEAYRGAASDAQRVLSLEHAAREAAISLRAAIGGAP